MLDYRIETFLTLCQERNYSKAAKQLCITQPAVTQHIQYLERYYNTKLFEYENKKLVLTKQGELLQRNMRSMYASDKSIYAMIQNSIVEKSQLVIGATPTLGEYFLIEVINRMLREQQRNIRVTLVIEHTQRILQLLEEGEICGAFVEGTFSKISHSNHLLGVDRFIPVTNEAVVKLHAKELLEKNLICRESDCGTRIILDELLGSYNRTTEDFANVIQVQSTRGVKELVKKGRGIAFLLESAIREEIKEGTLHEIKVLETEGEEYKKEYNFVILKDYLFQEDYMEFFEYSKTIYAELKEEYETWKLINRK